MGKNRGSGCRALGFVLLCLGLFAAACTDPVPPVANPVDGDAAETEQAESSGAAAGARPAEWVKVDERLDDVLAVASYDGGFISMRTAPGAVAFWLSPDGEEWERVHKAFLGDPGVPWAIGKIIVLPDNTLAAFAQRDQSYIWHSPDGREWVRVDNGEPWGGRAFLIDDLAVLDSGRLIASGVERRQGNSERRHWVSRVSALENSSLATLAPWFRLVLPDGVEPSSIVELDGVWLGHQLDLGADGEAVSTLQRSTDSGASWVAIATGGDADGQLGRGPILLPFPLDGRFVLVRPSGALGASDRGTIQTSGDGIEWDEIDADEGVFGDGPINAAQPFVDLADSATVLAVDVGVRWHESWCQADRATCRQTERRYLTIDPTGRWGLVDSEDLTPEVDLPDVEPSISVLASGELVVEYGLLGDRHHQLWIHRGGDVRNLEVQFPAAPERPMSPFDDQKVITSDEILEVDESDAAPARFTLDLVGDCVVLVGERGPLHAMWPPGTTVSPIGGVLLVGGVFIPFGAEVDLVVRPEGVTAAFEEQGCETNTVVTIVDSVSPIYPGVSVGPGWCDNGTYLLQFPLGWRTAVGFTHTPPPDPASVTACRLVWPANATPDLTFVGDIEVIRNQTETYGEGMPGIWVDVVDADPQEAIRQFQQGVDAAISNGGDQWVQNEEQGDDGRRILFAAANEVGPGGPALSWLVVPWDDTSAFRIFTANAIGVDPAKLREVGDDLARTIRRSRGPCIAGDPIELPPPTEPGEFSVAVTGELNPDSDGGLAITVTNNGTEDVYVDLPYVGGAVWTEDGTRIVAGLYRRALYLPTTSSNATPLAPGESTTRGIAVGTSPCDTSTGPRLAPGTYRLRTNVWTYSGPFREVPDPELVRTIEVDAVIPMVEQSTACC